MINKPKIVHFKGGDVGPWAITSIHTVKGETLGNASHLLMTETTTLKSNGGVWTLKGFDSNLRYTESQEKEELLAVQQGLGRPEARCAALIPIRKNEAWWELAQDERRAIFEKQSHHTETGLKYLPAIARKLFHCRDIGQPFDFLTWFEYAPSHAGAFEELVATLRKTEEWKFVDREVDIRLEKI